jgi:transposase
MMGLKERAFAPKVSVPLEELVPQDHFYRYLQKVLDLSFVYDLVRESYAIAGRPSIDPVVFFKLQLVLFFEDIRSERLLMRQVADRLSIRWYLGYDFGEPLPDHSSLTRIRTRYGIDVFRRFFERIVEQCQQAGLVWGKELYADATKIQANAALSSMKPRFAVEAHLANLFSSALEETVQTEDGASLQGRATCSLAPPHDKDAVVFCTEESLAVAAQTSSKASECHELPPQLHPGLDGATEADLSISNRERHDWIERLGEPARSVTHGTYRRMADFWVSTTDPDATTMNGKTGRSKLGYHTHYVVDGGKARIILAALVTPSEVMENQPILDLLWRTRFRWKLWPRQFTEDTTYGTADIIMALEQQYILPYVPLPDFDQHKASVCNSCPLKSRCTTSTTGRRISRPVAEEAFERVRAFHQTHAYKKAMNKRKVWVEPLFAEAKDWHGMRRFRLRRLWRVNCEALVVATGQNLKRLLKKRGWGRRPFPTEAMATMSPPNWEPEEFPRYHLLKSPRPGIAVASLVSCGATKTL